MVIRNKGVNDFAIFVYSNISATRGKPTMPNLFASFFVFLLLCTQLPDGEDKRRERSLGALCRSGM